MKQPNPPLLEMRGISKSFNGIGVLHNVSLQAQAGSVHALIGENGAGKSTLMKILAGLCQPDSGTVAIAGRRASFSNAQEAIAAGIAMIHQELSPAPCLNVAENIFLGRFPLRRSIFIDWKKLYSQTRQLLSSLNIPLQPESPVTGLSPALLQLLEVAKALSLNSKILIMDEPTSSLSHQEAAALFKLIGRLKQQGKAIIYISHKMDEIFKTADSYTVLRDGKPAASGLLRETDEESLIKHMVGRALAAVYPPKGAPSRGGPILRVASLSRKNLLKNISFELRAGEILGVAGLVGAGRTAMAETLFGVYPKDQGKIWLHGKPLDIKTPGDAIKNGLALLTEDRKLSGLYLPLGVHENMAISSLNQYIKRFLLNNKRLLQDCAGWQNSLRIKAPSLRQAIKTLSGGNQQKALLARWLMSGFEVLILDEPTRGIDIGAKAEIYALMAKLAQQGKAILMISSEMNEILGMSDRILVMRAGSICGELTRQEATQEKIMQLAMA